MVFDVGWCQSDGGCEIRRGKCVAWNRNGFCGFSLVDDTKIADVVRRSFDFCPDLSRERPLNFIHSNETRIIPLSVSLKPRPVTLHHPLSLATNDFSFSFSFVRKWKCLVDEIIQTCHPLTSTLGASRRIITSMRGCKAYTYTIAYIKGPCLALSQLRHIVREWWHPRRKTRTILPRLAMTIPPPDGWKISRGSWNFHESACEPCADRLLKIVLPFYDLLYFEETLFRLSLNSRPIRWLIPLVLRSRVVFNFHSIILQHLLTSHLLTCRNERPDPFRHTTLN